METRNGKLVDLVRKKRERLNGAINSVRVLGKMLDEERTGEAPTLTPDEQIVRARLEYGPSKPSGPVRHTRTDVVTGKLVGMTAEMSQRFAEGKVADVVDIFDRKKKPAPAKKDDTKDEEKGEDDFEALQKKNDANKRRIEQERLNANKGVLRSYRIKN